MWWRRNIRRLSRRLLTSISFLFLFAIIGAVVAEFIIELFKEWKWYDQPSARLGAIVTALSDFATQTWFLVTTAFLVGITAGLWLDSLLRRAPGLESLDADQIPSEPGFLDFIVEGNAASNDITKIFTRLGKDAARLGRTMSFYTGVVPRVQNFTIRRWLASRVARKLSRFSDRMRQDTLSIQGARQRVQNTYVPWIETANVNTEADVEALRSFASAAEYSLNGTLGMASAAEGARATMVSLRGMSRDLNAASDAVSSAIDDLISELRAFCGVCEHLRDTANRRAQEALAS
jgi:hypothetical protein